MTAVGYNVWKYCYVEKIGELWYICYPDCTKAYHQGYKTQGWATRVLNELILHMDSRNDL
jgi:hypothetical protein